MDSTDGLDRGAFEALFRRLERPVYNVVYRWLWDPAEAADVVQDAFTRLWGMRDRVQLATVEPLVYRMALNAASNRLRRRRLWRWVGLEPTRADAAPGASERLADAEDERALRAAVDALPEKLRRVVMLCELSGMSYQQVADTLAVPVGTVGSRRNAALARLREVLGEARCEPLGEARREGAVEEVTHGR